MIFTMHDDPPKRPIMDDHVNRGRCSDEVKGYECTRPRGHEGSHDAGADMGNFAVICATWNYI